MYIVVELIVFGIFFIVWMGCDIFFYVILERYYIYDVYELVFWNFMVLECFSDDLLFVVGKLDNISGYCLGFCYYLNIVEIYFIRY